MAKHDILLYNSASKGFTTNINSDTVRIKGSSDELLSIENSSGTKNLQIDTIGSNFTFNAPLTASGNFSGSLATTASFGRVVANRFAGDASQMTNTPISDGTVSSSAQLADDISGSFDEGFTHSGAISGSSTSTGSFGFTTSTEYDSNINISGVTGYIPTNTISSSTQIASEISGAFDSGFEFTGTISGSSTSTGSFGKFIVGDRMINADGQFLTNISYTPSTFSSSFQIASEISGAFDEGFTYEGEISGSSTSTGSFGRVEVATKFGSGIDATDVSVTIPAGAISGSAQIASDVSGSFTSGFTHTGEIKGVVGIGLSGVWSAVGSAPNTLRDYAASAGSGGGTVDASKSALMFGGRVSPASVTCTEEWNGSTWTETGDLITDRIQHGGFGTTEAAVAVGSAPYPTITGTKTEEFNGTAWTEVNDIGTPAGGIYGMSAGTQNSGLILNAVNSAAPTSGTESYEYNGTNWSAGGDASVKHARGQMGGTQNSAVLFGGMTAASNTGETCTEEYDGTSFSTGGSLNVKHSEFGGDGASAANALAVGDSYGHTEAGTNVARCTEAYNGDSWTVKTDLPFKMGSSEYQGTATKGIVFGGYWRFPNLNSDLALMPQNYEWDDEGVAAMPNTGSFGKVNFASIGTAVDVTGITNFKPDNTISSSAQLAVNISGSFDEGFEFGITELQKTSASFVGVSGSAFAYADHSATTMSISSTCGSDFDYRIADSFSGGHIKGTSYYGLGSWSAGPNKIDDQSGHAGVGTQNSYLSAGGYKSPKDGVEKYNGSSWAASAPLLVEHCAVSGFGTQNAAAIVGGHNPTGNDTELYNGATFSNSTPMGSQRRYASTAGTQNAGLVFSGTSAPSGNTDQVNTETFNGNVWTEVNNLNIARGLASSGGTQNAAIIAGGYAHSPGAVRNCSEIWNGTNWTAISNLNTARSTAGGMGTQNHFVVGGGSTPSFTVNTEEWNGSTWSEQNNLGTARSSFSGGQGGLGSAGILAGGQIGSPTATNTVEFWNAGSSTTGSFGLLDVSNYSVTNSELVNQAGALTANSVSGSSQLAVSISGSFDEGFNYAGSISGSSTSTGSFSRFSAKNYNLSAEIDVLTASISNLVPDNLVSSSAQIASDISGSFDEGFNYVGNLSGSYDTTGSFNLIHALEYPNIDASAFLNHPTASGTVTGSSQFADTISGSFNEGFEFTGLISGSSNSTGSLNNFISDKLVTKNFLNNNGINVIPHVGDSFFDTRRYVPSSSNHLYSCGSCAEFSNGYDNGDGQLSIGRDGILNISFQTSSFSVGADGGNLGKTPGAWSAGPNLITATRPNMFGTANAAVTTGGATTQGEGSTTNHVQHYNGISFRLGVDTPKTYGAAGRGQGYGQSENDLALMRHYTSGGVTDHLQYNGHAWWNMTINSHVQRCNAAFGSQNAAVMTGGEGSDFSERAEEWNGHSWNIIGDAGQNRGASGAGTQNAGIIGPGQCSGGTQTYDGTTWSAASNAGAYSGASGAGHLSGTQNDAIGNGTSTQATWDGTAWATIVAKPEDRHQAGLAGGSGVAFLAGGGPNPGSSIATTLEWNNSFATGSFLVTRKIDSNYS